MLKNIIESIQNHLVDKKMCLIAIDGGGGAGKSTLANFLANQLEVATIVHMDDFYHSTLKRSQIKESGSNYDMKRLLKQVIEPISSGKVATYQRYDWGLDTLAESHEVIPQGLIIVEGCYAMSEALRAHYNLTLFVETQSQLRLERGLARDGEAMLDCWKEWMSDEDTYFLEQQPQDNANYVISGERMYEKY